MPPARRFHFLILHNRTRLCNFFADLSWMKHEQRATAALLVLHKNDNILIRKENWKMLQHPGWEREEKKRKMYDLKIEACGSMKKISSWKTIPPLPGSLVVHIMISLDIFSSFGQLNTNYHVTCIPVFKIYFFCSPLSLYFPFWVTILVWWRQC